MSLKKSFTATGKTCTVEFNVNATAASGAQKVYLVGEFNDWKMDANPMKKNTDGSFSLKMKLDINKEYQFRYCLDGVAWINDWKADCYVRSELANDDNSVVSTAVPADTKKAPAKKPAAKTTAKKPAAKKSSAK